MAQLVEAAIKMHKKGVFHRDLKMANILVDISAAVPLIRIVDFGCATFVRKKPYCSFPGTITRSSLASFWNNNFTVCKNSPFFSVFLCIAATISLAPPEWLTEKSYSAAPTTVWQLGALLHRMLHGTIFNTGSFIFGNNQLSSELSLGKRSAFCTSVISLHFYISVEQHP